MATHGARLLRYWRRLRPVPGGRRLFSWIVGRAAPYTGSIRPGIVELEPGRCVVVMRDRRRLRNHLRSIHAIALANLGEVASGLALVTALPDGVRGIPTALRVDYRKKARGRLEATGTADPPTPPTGEDVEHDVGASIRDAEGDVVAEIRVTWRIGRAQ